MTYSYTLKTISQERVQKGKVLDLYATDQEVHILIHRVNVTEELLWGKLRQVLCMEPTLI